MHEGEVDRVRSNGTGGVIVKTYYAHLFNDALIYSQRNLTGKFKLFKAIDLEGAVISTAPVTGITNTFSITTMDQNVEIFRVRLEELGMWVTLVQELITAAQQRKGKINRRASNIATVPQDMMSAQSKGPRAKFTFEFLMGEISIAETMVALGQSVIQPLVDSSRGAVLKVGHPTGATSGGAKALFEEGTGNAARLQAQDITHALQAADLQIFLRAAESLSTSLREFEGAVREKCTRANWSEEVTVGAVFTSASVTTLFSQLKSYSSGLPTTMRILKSPLFGEFWKEADQVLAEYPGTLQEKLDMPRNRVKAYFDFLQGLQGLTPDSHPDHAAVAAAIAKVSAVSAEVEGTLKDKQNFEKLLQLQESLVVQSSMFKSVDSGIVQRLASTERKFLKEGDLKKVCRKSNKTFRFWLLSDYLIYGEKGGSGQSYVFHRAMDLKTVTVGVHNGATIKHAFEIFGAEKSFIVICSSQVQQQDWIDRINQAREALGVAATLEASTAPLWMPDHGSDKCSICKLVRQSLNSCSFHLS